MEKLPLEILVKTLGYLDIMDVTRNCILVCKALEQASRCDLRTRKYLTIRLKKHMDWTSAFKCVKTRMIGVKHLCIDGTAVFYKERHVSNRRVVNNLILSLAPNLVTIDLKVWMILPNRVVYQSLVQLKAYVIENKTLTACPKLQSIECHGHFNATLMPATVERLNITVRFDDNKHALLTQQLDVISCLENLTDLRVNGLNGKLEFLSVFRSGPNLVSFRIESLYARDNFAGEIDAAVEVLVQRNPRLETIHVTGIDGVSDHGLTSMSRLRGLKNLHILHKGTRVTGHGLLSLFRGPSGHLLQDVDIRMKSGSALSFADRQEIQSIPSEKQRTFNYGHGFEMFS